MIYKVNYLLILFGVLVTKIDIHPDVTTHGLWCYIFKKGIVMQPNTTEHTRVMRVAYLI
jgi:hypothetical protein